MTQTALPTLSVSQYVLFQTSLIILPSLLTFGVFEAMFQLLITTQTSRYIRILFTLVHKVTPCKGLLH